MGAHVSRFYQSTLAGKPGERHLFAIRTEGESSPTCLTCDLVPECLYSNAYFSSDATFYVMECLGPGVPRVQVHQVEGNKLSK